MKPTTRDGYRLFHKGTLALATMEKNGFRIDTAYLDKTIATVTKTIKEKEEAIKSSKVWRKWKHRFDSPNLDSNQQLAEILFKDMGFKPAAYTEKSKQNEDKSKWVPATDEHSLSKIDLPFLRDYFSVKKLKKTLGTYLLGIRREVCDGLLHPSYNLAGGISGAEDEKGGANSYRGSCQMPNAQNIPVRNPEMAKLIRPAFIARKGRRIVERDFAGVEVRVACCYTKDPQLTKEFTGPGGNPHGVTAQQLFFLKKEEVEKKTTRDIAKNKFVFPQFYGSVWFQCAPDIWEELETRNACIPETPITIQKHLRKHGIKELGDCSEPDRDQKRPDPARGTFARHVMEVERDFWQNRFKVYTAWKKSWYDQYMRRGYFDLLTGFRCTGMYRRNQVLNFAIQGSAFHCLLWSIIEIQREITKHKMRTLLIGQIHDSLLADVPDDEVQDYLDLTEEITSKRLVKAWDWITVPMAVEAEVCGANWYEKCEWQRNQFGLWAAA